MVKKVIVFFVVLACFDAVVAKIIPFASMENIWHFIESERSLVLLDAHNTLVESTDKKLEAKMHHADKDKKLTVDEKYVTYKWLNVQPVEACIPALVAQLQKKYSMVAVLTASHGREMSHVLYQLCSVGIDLACSWLAYTDPIRLFLPSGLAEDALFYKGIIFASTATKGEALKAFLTCFNLQPLQIVFVDDKLANHNDMQKAADELGIPYVGLWYSASRKSKSRAIQQSLCL